ncbi:MAG: hypothetical protein Kow0090_12540 [Myxococcota bacterium]
MRTTRLNPRNAVLAPYLAKKIDERKSAEDSLPYYPQQFSTPALNGGIERIYLGTEHSGFYALDGTNGRVLWRFAPEDGAWSSTPLVAGDVVYTGENNGIMYALKAKTGEPIWSYTTEAPIRSKPALVDGKLVFINAAGRVTALDAASGEWLWHTGGESLISKMRIMTMVGPLPVGDGDVAVAFPDGAMALLNGEDGTEIWKRKLGRAVDFRDIGGGIINSPYGLIVSVYNTGLFWLNPRDGNTLREATDILFPAAIEFDGARRLLVATGGSKLYMLSAESGKRRWSYNFNRGYVRHPVFYGGFVIAPHSTLGVFILNGYDGSAEQVLRSGHGVLSQPLIFEDRVFIFSNAGYFYGFVGDILPIAIKNG